MARAWSGDHPVNIRLSIPLPFGRYYLTVVGGRERRGRDRLASERRTHPLLTGGNVVFLLVLAAMVGLAVVAALQLAGGFMLQNSNVVTW